jgi:hypothetical protein
MGANIWNGSLLKERAFIKVDNALEKMSKMDWLKKERAAIEVENVL